MQLVWSQIVTHIIGFVIAVLILKRYAWGPILKLLEERRQKIQGEFDRIETERADAAALKTEYEGQLRGIDAQARVRIQEGVQEGQKIGTEIKEEARRDAHLQQERAREEIEREKDKAQVALRNEMVEMVVHATETLLRETLDAERHRRLAAEYIESLQHLEEKAR